MEWDFKDFAWDSSSTDDQLGQQKDDQDSDLAALVGSSICISQVQGNHHHHHPSSGGGSFQVDLKLASAADVADSAARQVYGKNPTQPSSVVSPPSSRRVKINNGSDQQNQKVSCLVDGCKADLRRCREYHRRHRVCELHSKTPVVKVRDEQKRFCQQCSRFHFLVEFDEVKRSCRKRLNGHNQRRRKPKPESLYFTSDNFFSTIKGPRILQFSNPQLCATTTNVRSMWPVETRKGAEPMLYNRRHPWFHAIEQQSPPNSFNIAGEKPFLFLQTTGPKSAAVNRAAPQAFMCQRPFPTNAASPESRKDSSHTMSSDSMARVSDSSYALYLLSSNPTQNSVTEFNRSVQSNSVTSHLPGQVLNSIPEKNYFSEISCSHEVEDRPVNPEMTHLMGHDGFSDHAMLPILQE